MLFFPAEDGLRVTSVTGVRTCALPLFGSSNSDERCCRRTGPALAAKQLDISYHLNAGSPREPHRPVRRRVRERHAGGEHKRDRKSVVQGKGVELGARRMTERKTANHGQ